VDRDLREIGLWKAAITNPRRTSKRFIRETVPEVREQLNDWRFLVARDRMHVARVNATRCRARSLTTIVIDRVSVVEARYQSIGSVDREIDAAENVVHRRRCIDDARRSRIR